MAARVRRLVTGWLPALVLVVWILAILATQPRGNFPIDDDWSFAGVVSAVMVDHARFAMPWFAEMSLVTHVAWGSAFVALAGFSHEALRASTIVLTGAGLIAIWGLALRCDLSRGSAAFVTASFALNPVVFFLTNTYMTDVPFAVWTTCAAMAFAMALREPSWRAIVAATAFSVGATMLRQTGILLPLAFGPALLLTRGMSRRVLAAALLPAVITLAVLGIYTYWIGASGRAGALYGHFLGAAAQPEAATVVVRAAFARLLNVLFHLCCFMMPVVLWTMRRPASPRARAQVLATVGLVVIALWWSGRVGPWGVSHFYNLGLGNPNVRGVDPAMLPQAPVWMFRAFTLAAGATGALLLIRCATYARHVAAAWRTMDRHELGIAVMFGAVVGAMVAAMTAIQFFDRYIIFLVPMLAVLCELSARTPGAEPWRPGRVLGVVALAGYAAFAVAGTHDFFEWRRAHYATLQRVETSGQYIAAEIDGGLEFVRQTTGRREFPPAPKVVVTLGDLDGYRRCEAVPFFRWMPRQDGLVLVLVPAAEPCPVLRATSGPGPS